MRLHSLKTTIPILSGLILSSALAGAEGKKLRLLPFTEEKPVVNQNSQDVSVFALTADANPTIQSELESNLRSRGLDDSISLIDKSVAKNKNAFLAGFEYGGYEICNIKIKATRLPGGQLTILGEMPVVSENPDLEFRNDLMITEYVLEKLASEGLDGDIYISEKSKCLWNTDEEELAPAFKVKFESGKERFEMTLNEDRVFEYTTRDFHANAKTTVFDTNIYGSLTQYDIRNIDNPVGGYYFASNDKFTTVMADGSSRFRSSDTTFTPSVGSTNFDEVSLFTNANRTLDWLESVGYDNFGNNRITIVVHDTVSNNALYQPDNNTPLIKVGEGDGTLLANLSTDADVVSHELGHHVVYGSITKITGESLVLHEGLSDFFTFAKTGDTCLGESICPSGSDFCYKENQCLRTADNDLSLDMPSLPPQAHLRSQLISGFLWDFIGKDGVPADTWAGLVLKAINILNYNSGYQDLLLSLLVVDAAEYDGAYCEKIYARAGDRGMSSYLSAYGCDEIADDTATSYSSGSKISSILDTNDQKESSSSSSSGGGGWCGSIASGSSETTAILYILPLMLVALRRKED